MADAAFENRAFADRADALYALPLEAFVAERKRLAGELKKQGDTAGARALEALAKPILSAWLTNQTVRRAAALVKELFAATSALAAAQGTPGAAGDSTRKVQAAAAEQREVVARLTEVAQKIVDEAGMKADAAVIERVANNLRWGAIAGADHAALERGRLVHDVASPGFAAFAEMSLNASPPAPDRAALHAQVEKRPTAPRDDLAERRQAAEKARTAAELERARQRDLAALEHARKETVVARRAHERAEAARAAAEARVTAAEAALETARAAASTASDQHRQAAATLRAREEAETAARAKVEASRDED